MKRKDEIKLEMLSNIDDDIIEKQTLKRYDLLTNKPKKSNNKKQIFTIVGIAACFIIICSVLLTVILPMLSGPTVTKQVPVYQGMTVTMEPPITDDSVQGPFDKHHNISYLSAKKNYSRAGNKVVLLDTSNNDTINTEDSEDILYYTVPNSDIYINVHIDNPDQLEILSFTLNGVKYQSYMFEEGSDSQTLVLKVNVGDVKGTIEYTIDAIKYVEETEIKDVKMEGDQTIKVGIISELIQGGYYIVKGYSDDIAVYNETTNEYRYHYGIDIEGVQWPMPVNSALSGIVTDVYFDNSMGNTVVISSSDGKLVWYYQCLDEIYVEKGQTVTGGDAIGMPGTSAPIESADWPHVHIEIYVDGERIDPNTILKLGQ